MASKKNGVIGRVVVAGMVAGLVVIAAGCSTTGPMHRADLPSNVQVVGGGFSINWEAPAKGTVYLVERTSGKIIVTQAVEEGDPYELNIDPEDGAETFKAATGVSLADARLVLYFKAAARKSSAP